MLPRPDGQGEQLDAQPPMPASADAKPGGVASEESARERSTPRRGRLAYGWERWLRYFWLPLVICGAFVALLVIALTQSNVKDRARLADEFSLRTAVSGRLVESYLSSEQALMVARAEDLLSGSTITPENLKLALSGLGYQAGGALDGRGRALITQPYTTAVIGQDYSRHPENTRIAVQQDRPGVSQALIVELLKAPGVAMSVPYRAQHGRRIFNGVFALQGPTLSRLTRQVVGPERAVVDLIDRHGIVIASTIPAAGALPSLSRREPALARGLARGSTGSYQTDGRRYRYAWTPIAGTGGWRLVSSVAEATLYGPLSAGESADRWLIVGSVLVGLVAAVTFALITRRRKLAEAAVHELNQQLERRACELQAVAEEMHELNAKLEQRVSERTAELRSSNEELEAFVYTVSHDLRAPLRAMDGFSRLLLDSYQLDARGRDWLSRVRTGAQRMGRMIDELLRLAHVSRVELRHEQVDVTGLARGIASELRSAEPQRNVEFVIPENLTASGDPDLLRLVLENLLSNAWKFTSTHERATIQVGICEHDGDTAFFVRDDGVGFDMAYAAQLFKPFQRLHRADEFAGTGIGLAGVQRIVTRHGGRIWADAKPDRGATFTFTLGPDRGSL